MLRDALFQRLSEPLYCDYMESQPVMVFINGEFWGMYNARERYDDKYFKAHYGIQEENLVLLEAPTPLKYDMDFTRPYEICEGFREMRNLGRILSDTVILTILPMMHTTKL